MHASLRKGKNLLLLAFGESLTDWYSHMPIMLTGLLDRLIALEASKELHDTSGAEASFEAAWGKILAGQPLVCAKTGSQYDPVPVHPSAVVLDVSYIKRHWSGITFMGDNTALPGQHFRTCA